jgi:hypothetical protein
VEHVEDDPAGLPLDSPRLLPLVLQESQEGREGPERKLATFPIFRGAGLQPDRPCLEINLGPREGQDLAPLLCRNPLKPKGTGVTPGPSPNPVGWLNRAIPCHL